MGTCFAVMNKGSVGVAVSNSIGARIREVEGVAVSINGFVGRGIRAILGRNETDGISLIGVGVAICKIIGVLVGEIDRAGVSSSGFVGMGDCALSGRKGVAEPLVSFIWVGKDSDALSVGLSRFTQPVRHRHTMINTPSLKILMVLCGVAMDGLLYRNEGYAEYFVINKLGFSPLPR
jgi:hypothetical protein